MPVLLNRRQPRNAWFERRFTLLIKVKNSRGVACYRCAGMKLLRARNLNACSSILLPDIASGQ